jgi:hypothetical protein
MSSTRHSRYDGRKACLATLHEKLELIAPAMDSNLGLKVFAVEIDTDRFGTFTGEIERPMNMHETALLKARAGMTAVDSRIGFASEGSIGSTEFFPLISNVEIVAFVDEQEGFQLSETAVSFDILAHRWSVDGGPVLDKDLEFAGFPEHGLIVRPEHAPTPVFKGIHRRDGLETAIAACISTGSERAVIESDFRANHCPSRRPTIRRAAERLAQRLATVCPACDCPGWGPVDDVKGRKCAECRWPTSERLAFVMGCCRCELRRTGPITTEPADPSRCPRCNP